MNFLYSKVQVILSEAIKHLLSIKHLFYCLPPPKNCLSGACAVVTIWKSKAAAAVKNLKINDKRKNKMKIKKNNLTMSNHRVFDKRLIRLCN